MGQDYVAMFSPLKQVAPGLWVIRLSDLSVCTQATLECQGAQPETQEDVGQRNNSC